MRFAIVEIGQGCVMTLTSMAHLDCSLNKKNNNEELIVFIFNIH